jgi:hypothetical protein
MNRARPKPSMGVSSFTAADHLMTSLVMQVRRALRGFERKI